MTARAVERKRIDREKTVEAVPAVITPKTLVCFRTCWFVVLNKQTHSAEKVFSGDHTGPHSITAARKSTSRIWRVDPRRYVVQRLGGNIQAGTHVGREGLQLTVYRGRRGAEPMWKGSGVGGRRGVGVEEEVINKAAEGDETKV